MGAFTDKLKQMARRSGSGSNIGGDSRDIPEQDVPVGEAITLAVRAESGTATVRSAFRTAELR